MNLELVKKYTRTHPRVSYVYSFKLDEEVPVYGYYTTHQDGSIWYQPIPREKVTDEMRANAQK